VGAEPKSPKAMPLHPYPLNKNGKFPIHFLLHPILANNVQMLRALKVSGSGQRRINQISITALFLKRSD
jgi:hypothetical protein